MGKRRENIHVVLGTRPEIVKLAQLIRLLEDEARVVYTGQHYDEELGGAFFDAFRIPRPRALADVGGLHRGEQIGRGLSALTRLWTREGPPDVVVVQGDTNSALTGALAANAVDAWLVHLEAGLRSYDRAMPEEHNRVLIDHLADLCLAPTPQARANLEREGVAGRVVVTGNTIVEAVRELLPSAEEREGLLARRGLKRNAFILGTVHRPENSDDPDRLKAIMSAFAAMGFPVVLPLHPRTRACVADFGLADLLQTAPLQVEDPLDYRTFLGLFSEAALIVSDSGGVQEEASVLKRPALVVRRSTERPEVLGTFTELVDAYSLLPAALRALERTDESLRALFRIPSPYGDGTASTRALHEIRALSGLSRKVHAV